MATEQDIQSDMYAQDTMKKPIYKEPTLYSEDDARDLSIHLTDNILNHFENYIPKDYVNAMEELSEYGEFELPTTLVNPLRDTIEKPHIKIWFDDEKGNRGSFYSWELQDLITELVMKRFNIEL